MLKSILTYLITIEAKLALRRFAPRIVAVTGSVGKTSTKDAIYAAVAGSFVTRKSDKSFNSEIGVPLAVLGLPNAWSSVSGWLANLWEGAKIVLLPRSYSHFPELLVLEVGADHPGDIARTVAWVKPDIAVLTRMSETPVHVEYFSGPEEVLAEKMKLAEAVDRTGSIVVNGDDPLFMQAVRRLDTKHVTYGFGKPVSVRITEAEITYDQSPLLLPTGIEVELSLGGQDAPQSLEIGLQGVLGSHLAYSIAAAITVAHELGIDLHDAVKSLSLVDMPKGRMRILEGKAHSAIIDDTYNASPIACEEALRSLEKVAASRGRKIAVLGDMKELGVYSDEAHRKTGELAAGIVHTLVTVGEEARFIAQGARSMGLADDRIFVFDTSTEAAPALAEMIRAGDVVLVKGSQSMRMERISAALLADPASAEDVLVRQEKEWQER